MSVSIDISFKLNGVNVRTKVTPGMSALEMLRDELQLTGTKYGCGEGECGACTINVDGQSLNSCLLFAADCDGREIVTIEGLAMDARAEALKKSFVNCGAVQCGFCTPGIVVQAWQCWGRRNTRRRTKSGAASKAIFVGAPVTRRSSKRSLMPGRC